MAQEHPIVIDPHDPLVERVRAICRGFPDVAEVRTWGRPTFRAGTRIFLLVSASMHRPYSIVFKPIAAEHPAYLADERFFSPPYWGPGGWLAIDIDRPDTDWTLLAELVDTSYRQVALKRQIAQLDAL
jgi:predicted DNA-binding protein (MmcQ/YjbR family)